MAVDTPARIAVLGAGPVGLESALYARFLGYDVDLYERTSVAGNVLSWGHVRMFSPFRLNRSPLGLAALAAQDQGYRAPADDSLLTGREWVERYLQPLAQTDLLADQLHQYTAVAAVGREGGLKAERLGDARRARWPFRLLLRERDGCERTAAADLVIDATGVFGNPNWMGPGGGPAVGETALRREIEYGLPDVLGARRGQYAGRHTLLVGAGYSAATTVAALAQLGREEPNSRVTWIARCVSQDADSNPVAEIPGDSLPERLALAQTANRYAAGESPCVTYWPGATVAAVQLDADRGRYVVQLAGEHAGVHEFDRVIANVGYRPDDSVYEELQVCRCCASGSPVQWDECVLTNASANCPQPAVSSPKSLRLVEPNFYVLGAKSRGRCSDFLVSAGLEQIRRLFAIIGGRRDLDLYATVKHLPM